MSSKLSLVFVLLAVLISVVVCQQWGSLDQQTAPSDGSSADSQKVNPDDVRTFGMMRRPRPEMGFGGPSYGFGKNPIFSSLSPGSGSFGNRPFGEGHRPRPRPWGGRPGFRPGGRPCYGPAGRPGYHGRPCFGPGGRPGYWRPNRPCPWITSTASPTTSTTVATTSTTSAVTTTSTTVAPTTQPITTTTTPSTTTTTPPSTTTTPASTSSTTPFPVDDYDYYYYDY